MQSTAKDPLSEVASALNNEGQSSPANAAGAEIPVTVHASRYSASSKGAGKLPPVHEETRTVIIFPQGAVVRLSATVTPGELVVLTNKRTGADVICRVTSVKTQPGIQNYVRIRDDGVAVRARDTHDVRRELTTQALADVNGIGTGVDCLERLPPRRCRHATTSPHQRRRDGWRDVRA